MHALEGQNGTQQFALKILFMDWLDVPRMISDVQEPRTEIMCAKLLM